MDEKKILQAAELIKNSEYLVAFTGAGISVESGVPPFRGEDGLWRKYDQKVLDIKNNINNFRKIKDPLDNPENNSNIIETAFKKDTFLILVQFRNSGGLVKSVDWYFYDGLLIYSETIFHNGSYNYCYFYENKLLSWIKNGENIEDRTSEEYNEMVNAGEHANTILNTRYADK